MGYTRTSQQAAAIDWALNGKGHANLVARAGCGKTSTITDMVQEITRATPHARTFIGAYNKSIALELQATLRDLKIDWRQAEAGTMHSIGFRAWKKGKGKIKVDGNKVRNLADIHAINRTHPGAKELGPFAVKLVDFAKGEGFGVATLRAPDYMQTEPWERLVDHHDIYSDVPEDMELADGIEFAIRLYHESLALCDTIVDFNDMILAPLVNNTGLFKYDWVMVDEAQDTNPTRRELAFRLLKRGGRFVAVGDPKQAIYGFTGADARAMDLIAEEKGSIELPLTQTFRCGKSIVALAQTMVPDIEAADTNSEGEITGVPLNKDMPGGDQGCFWDMDLTNDDAILCRNTAPLVELAYALIRRGTACKVEGRDIGASILKLVNRWQAVKNLDQLADRVLKYREDQIARHLKAKRENQAQTIADRCDTVLALTDALSSEGKTSLNDLRDFIKQLFDTQKPGTDQKLLTLATVHKAKGREWDRVFLLGRSTLMPSRWARTEWQQDQEINLQYVAITRAKTRLVEVDLPSNAR